MKSSYFRYLYILLATVLISACGGGNGGGGGGNNDEVLTGVFVNSPVEGLRWESGDMAGTTDAAGTFQYKSGAMVKFYVGDILIGKATGHSIIIPLDLIAGAQDITNTAVTNITRFLMTLDNDNNPANGIKIIKASADLAIGKTVDFNQTTSAFAADGAIQILITELTSATDAGARSLTSVSDAQTHEENSIKKLLAGSYSGTFSGTSSGTWTAIISTTGAVSGTATSSVETVSFSGVVGTKGSGATDFTTRGGASDGTVFSGAFNRDGTGSGTWNWNNINTGTWSGSKTDSATSVGRFDGAYTTALIPTTERDMNGQPCAYAVGLLDIIDSELSGSVSDGRHYVYDINGNVRADGRVTGIFSVNGINAASFEGMFSGDTAGDTSGTWVDNVQCSGIWQVY